MKTYLQMLLLAVLFFQVPRLRAELPVMPADTYRTCIAELKDAIKNKNVEAVKRQAANLKTYGLQAEGARIIQEARANNADMRSQVREGYESLVSLRDAASRKSIKACYTLITNLEKKFMSDMISTASGAVIGGGAIADLRNAINDVQGNYDAAQVIKQNGNAIKDLDGLAKSCSRLLATLDPIKTELGNEGRDLENLEKAFTDAAAKTDTKDVKPKDKDKDKDKNKDTDKDDNKDKPKTDPTPPPEEKKTVPPKDANTSAGGSGSSGETTVFKGYVSDASGKEKIGLTETTDKDGKVIKTTYTTTDKDGKVIAVKTYGPDGKLISDTKAPSQSSAAAAVAKETAKTIARPPRPAIPSCSCP
jgi:hypothetical protein